MVHAWSLASDMGFERIAFVFAALLSLKVLQIEGRLMRRQLRRLPPGERQKILNEAIVRGNQGSVSLMLGALLELGYTRAQILDAMDVMLAKMQYEGIARQ